MSTFREYHVLYLLTDVLLLVESFREMAISKYELGPIPPDFAWDAMLKI